PHLLQGGPRPRRVLRPGSQQLRAQARRLRSIHRSRAPARPLLAGRQRAAAAGVASPGALARRARRTLGLPAPYILELTLSSAWLPAPPELASPPATRAARPASKVAIGQVRPRPMKVGVVPLSPPEGREGGWGMR